MKVLLVQTGFLGDVILSSAVIEQLRQITGAHSLTVVTTPAARELIAHDPAVDEVLVFDKRRTQSGAAGLWKMAGELRKRRFSIGVTLHKSLRSALLLRLAGIPKRYGFCEASGSFLYTRCATRKEYQHDVIRNLAVLKCFDVDPLALDATLRLVTSPAADARAEAEMSRIDPEGVGAIGLAPGSVWATKQWTAEGFAAVARSFLQQGRKVVLIGGGSDRDIAARIEAQVPQSARSAGFHNLVGTLSLGESAAIVARMKLLITNDSAPLHMASAKRIPIVAVFCATVPEFGYGPWQVPHECVGVEGLSCRPCGRHGGATCPTGTHACQLQLGAGEVLAAAERVLAQVSP